MSKDPVYRVFGLGGAGGRIANAVARATAKAGAHARLLFAGGQGPDHPVHCAMPETAYLKCLAVQISR